MDKVEDSKLNDKMRDYFRKLGQQGGRSKSEAKQRAAKTNLIKARKIRWRAASPKVGS